MIRRTVGWMIGALVLVAQPVAQAGVIEDLLAIPAIQSMLGRLPELNPLVRRCQDVTYQQRNATVCQQATQAYQLAQMPSELRAVMSTPPAAASLRALCLGAIGTPAYNGYLCSELARFDATFQAQSQSKQIQQQEQRDRQMR